MEFQEDEPIPHVHRSGPRPSPTDDPLSPGSLSVRPPGNGPPSDHTEAAPASQNGRGDTPADAHEFMLREQLPRERSWQLRRSRPSESAAPEGPRMRSRRSPSNAADADPEQPVSGSSSGAWRVAAEGSNIVLMSNLGPQQAVLGRMSAGAAVPAAEVSHLGNLDDVSFSAHGQLADQHRAASENADRDEQVAVLTGPCLPVFLVFLVTAVLAWSLILLCTCPASLSP